MTKRFTTRNGVFYTDTKTGYEFQCYGEVADIMNELADENEQLKSEINMLKNTIGRNEAFIKRITFNGEWNNTSMKQGD